MESYGLGTTAPKSPGTDVTTPARNIGVAIPRVKSDLAREKYHKRPAAFKRGGASTAAKGPSLATRSPRKVSLSAGSYCSQFRLTESGLDEPRRDDRGDGEGAVDEEERRVVGDQHGEGGFAWGWEEEGLVQE